ncbi:hypothetical protein NPIL_268761 [Nephila pilipes]|uniref:Secreted protein n=1 Tax=Nephila pilipes TaxID=299642 RepID=A0A8X6TJJ8_NEPPI|nr:hypothetical protein NPIL_268761 [Nephila pilipes]
MMPPLICRALSYLLIPAAALGLRTAPLTALKELGSAQIASANCSAPSPISAPRCMPQRYESNNGRRSSRGHHHQSVGRNSWSCHIRIIEFATRFCSINTAPELHNRGWTSDSNAWSQILTLDTPSRTIAKMLMQQPEGH